MTLLESDALKPSRIGFPNLRWFRWMRARRKSAETSGKDRISENMDDTRNLLGMKISRFFGDHGFLPQNIMFDIS